tara:strand:- start:8 stop:979 length:972 start_codon:yes stop_codon:yes gene_type:complete
MALDCSIVIPNYNGEYLLQKYLPSVLEESLRYKAECEVIVVDDASSDASTAILEEKFPTVRIVRHEVNQGFAEAIYSGVSAARHELVFLLNSDVELHPGCLNLLESRFERDNTFAVNPLILNQDGVVNQSSWTRSTLVRGHLKLLPWDIRQLPAMKQSGDDFPTLYCSGGSVMMRKSMFETLGGFSPLYKPFYYEDFDLGLRAWYRGWYSYFEPAAEVSHADKGTIEDNFKSELIKSTQRRNRYKLEWTHFSPGTLCFKTLPFSLLQLLGEIILFDRKNVRAFFAALADLKAIRAQRKSLRQAEMTLAEVLQLNTQEPQNTRK